jgi:hypothetical protein
VWKEDGVISHFAFHAIHADGRFTVKATKMAKADAIKLLETTGNTATTLTWNYALGNWTVGQPVSVAGNGADKYLKSAPDNKVSDNLGHLICWNCYV